jgi:hypothetical protein
MTHTQEKTDGVRGPVVTSKYEAKSGIWKGRLSAGKYLFRYVAVTDDRSDAARGASYIARSLAQMVWPPLPTEVVRLALSPPES